jgi:hypothetical protein
VGSRPSPTHATLGASRPGQDREREKQRRKQDGERRQDPELAGSRRRADLLGAIDTADGARRR